MKQADVTAALVLSTLKTWRHSADKGYRSKKQRQSHTIYRSLRNLHDELPFLDDTTIMDALERLERAYPKDFKVDRNGNHINNFSISDKLVEGCLVRKTWKRKKGENVEVWVSRSKQISMTVKDAMKYGPLKAMLIRNLEYKTDPEHCSNPLKDAEGHIYGEISASKLVEPKKKPDEDGLDDRKPDGRIYLPYCRQEVQKAIGELKGRRRVC